MADALPPGKNVTDPLPTRFKRIYAAANDGMVHSIRDDIEVANGVTYPAGSESCPADKPMTHSGSEYGIVLDGQLGATVGEESYELGPGDSIAFQSRTPHRIWNIGETAALAVWTVVGRASDPRVAG